ncbi:hypothetical protein FOA52_011254 [Chlamydomonas sp. UWO 241]|nr:hypothetical protein FOA52_011254 [Chlamydomonas sp. UWO 241]
MAHWTDTRLLDHRANKRAVAANDAGAARAVAALRATDAALLDRTQSHGYSFDVAVRPPCPTLDRVTDYLTIKYQDAFAQKDEAMAVAAAGASSFDGVGASAPRAGAAAALSPQEVASLNADANAAFESIGVTGSDARYASLLKRTHARGLIDARELAEALAAGRLRTADARAAAAAAADADARTPQAGAARDALHAALTGVDGAGLPAAAPKAVAAARKLWEGAATAGYAAWARRMAEHAKVDIAVRRAAGESISEKDEKDLLAWWETPASFDEASAVWGDYLSAARRPHAPRLEEMLLLDQEARSAAGGAAAAATAHAADAAEQLRDAYEAFVAVRGEGGSGTCAPLARPATGPGGGGAAAAAAARDWDGVQVLNASLDVASPASLFGAFPRATLRDALSRHWASVAARHLPAGPTSPDASSGHAPPQGLASFDDLWGLMLRVRDATLVSAGATGAVSSTSYGLAGFSPATSAARGGGGGGAAAAALAVSGSIGASAGVAVAAAPAPAGGHAGVSNDDPAWLAYVEGQDASAPAPGTASTAAQSASAPPPYPGASPLLRFTQAFVLGPSASTSATSAATPAALLGPANAAGSLDDSPDNRAVELRVRVGALRAEAGLSPAAMAHVLDVVGPERVDAQAGEIVLSADRYVRREENRRLLLEQLHQLIEEGHAHAPSPDGYVFDRVRSPFL